MPTSGTGDIERLIAVLDKEAEQNHDSTRHLAPVTLDEMIAKYGGLSAPAYLEEIEHIEHALDEVWPTWNDPDMRKRRFSHLKPEDMRPLKWLLRRRRNIVNGLGDWGVAIAEGKNGKPVAIPVKPRRGAYEKNPQAFRRWVSVPLLASKAGVTLAEAEEAFKARQGDRGTWLEWVERYAMAKRKVEAFAEPAPAPEEDGGEA